MIIAGKFPLVRRKVTLLAQKYGRDELLPSFAASVRLHPALLCYAFSQTCREAETMSSQQQNYSANAFQIAIHRKKNRKPQPSRCLPVPFPGDSRSVPRSFPGRNATVAFKRRRQPMPTQTTLRWSNQADSLKKSFEEFSTPARVQNATVPSNTKGGWAA